jgi:hypothetical protein
MQPKGQPRRETDERRADYARRYGKRVELAKSPIFGVCPHAPARAGLSANFVEVLFKQ